MSDELQKTVEGAVSEMRTATKELEAKGAQVSEIKEKLDRVNDDLKEFDKANQELMDKIAKSEQDAEALKDAEDRIKELEIKAAQFGNSGTDSEFAKKQALESEIKDLKHFCTSGEITDKKYLRSDSNVDGGFLMMESYDSEILKPIREISDMRPYARVKQRSTLRNNFIVESTPAQAYWNGENVTPTESNPAYAKRGIQLQRITTESYATLEALMGSEWDLETEITGGQVDAKNEKEGTAFISGTGVSQPFGLISRLVTDARLYASGDASALTVTSILQMPGEVKAGYTNAIYAMNNKTLYNIRSLADPDGRLGWQPGNIAAGVPSQINGKAYAIFPDMADVAADAYPLFFGDIRKAYTICDGMEAIVQRIFNKKGGYEFLMYSWVGADVVMPEAGLVMKVATSV